MATGNGTTTGDPAIKNSIPVISTYLKDVLDEIYETEAKTTGMTPDPAFVRAAAQAGKINVATIKTTGLGTYSAINGFTSGAGSVEWSEYTLAVERSIRYLADQKQTIEGGGLATATAFMSNAMREQFIPEIDAYRFSKIYSIMAASTDYASTHVKAESSALTAAGVLDAIIDGCDTIADDTGIDDGFTIYMSSALRTILHKSSQYTKTKNIGATDGVFDTNLDTINGNQVVWVPKTRMYTAIDLKDGLTNAISNTATGAVDYTKFGYAPASGAKGLNFVITAPKTAMGIVASENVKIIPAEQSEKYNGDQAIYYLWHDLIIPTNKEAGVYVSYYNSA